MEKLDSRWRKASRSDNGGNCVIVAGHDNRILVRDTKDRTGPTLRISADAWRRFTGRVKDASLGLTPACKETDGTVLGAVRLCIRNSFRR